MAFSKDHRVFLALRERLLLGHWRPGTPLKPDAIAAGLNVSVSPVREALIRLAERGLVNNIENLGFVVASFDPTTTAYYCRLLSQLYNDSLRKVIKASLLDVVSSTLIREAAAIASTENTGALCLRHVDLFRRTLLAKPYRAIVDQIGDVAFAHAASTVGSDAYFSALASEYAGLIQQLTRRDQRGAANAIRRYFARRPAEITRAEAQLSELPPSATPARSPLPG